MAFASVGRPVCKPGNSLLMRDDADPLLTERPTLFNAECTPSECSQILADPSYWRGLCPWLHVGSAEIRHRIQGSELIPTADLVDECRDRMIADGYWTIDQEAVEPDTDEPHLRWAVDIAGLSKGVETLAGKGWPPNFLLMYDETWLLAHQLKRLLILTSGNRLSHDFSIFHVVAGAAGWPPHRDRGGAGATDAFGPDRLPTYVTTWVALSDATVTNSCLHVVPKSHDPGYHGGDVNGVSPMVAILSAGGEAALQHIRALPCSAGSVICFSHRLLHWGSAAESGPAVRQPGLRDGTFCPLHVEPCSLCTSRVASSAPPSRSRTYRPGPPSTHSAPPPTYTYTCTCTCTYNYTYIYTYTYTYTCTYTNLPCDDQGT